MADRFSSLRLQIARSLRGGRSRATRYPAAARRGAVRLARAESTRGMAVAATARALGLRPRTLGLWLRSHRGPQLRRVEVIEASSPRLVAPEVRASVVTPQGYRVEGLDLSSLVRLLRELR